MAKCPDLQPGDIVRYTSTFLRNIGWNTNVPKDGLVTHVDTSNGVQYATIQWNDRDPSRVHHCNLQKHSKKKGWPWEAN